MGANSGDGDGGYGGNNSGDGDGGGFGGDNSGGSGNGGGCERVVVRVVVMSLVAVVVPGMVVVLVAGSDGNAGGTVVTVSSILRW